MSRRSFETHIRDSGVKHRPEGECACCDRPATHWVRVAFDYMRGNDEYYDVCQRHHSIAAANLSRLFAHARTKDRFVASKSQAAAPPPTPQPEQAR